MDAMCAKDRMPKWTADISDGTIESSR